MSVLAFMSLWQAQPFRPFRVRMRDGRGVDVLDPRQAAASPDLQNFVVLGAGGGVVMFQPHAIASCDPIVGEPAEPSDAPGPPAPPASGTMPADAVARLLAAGVDPAVIAGYEPDPGQVRTMASTATDGARLVHVAISDRAGRPMLNTLGTRWTLMGLDTFENGRTLSLIHADDPNLQRRVIVWPPDKATLDTYAEARPPAGVQAELAALDAAARAAPADLRPPSEYFASIVVPTPDDPPLLAEQCRVEALPAERGPHHLAKELRVLGPDGRPVLDLTSCGWFGEAERDGACWRLQLARADDDYYLRVQVDPARRAARIDACPWLAFPRFERVFRNSDLYEDPEALRRALAGAPSPGERPEVAFPLAGGHTLELWPGPRDVPTPFLHPRLLGPGGRALLDLRGSPWGAIVEWPDRLAHLPPAHALPGAAFALRLIHRDPRERHEASRPRLGIDLDNRRVVARDPDGAAPLGVLHALAHAHGVGSLLAGRLAEALVRGRGVV